jgi:uncharacterized protein
VAQNEALDIIGPAGRLEALLMHPEAAPKAAAVVCHAHPLHGGMMHFKVVFRAAKALQSQRVAVLRFNFRGVGRSEGTYDHGIGEQDDARAALDTLERAFPGLPLLVGGFSFGAMVGLRLASEDERVRAAFALGFPVTLAADPSFLSKRSVPRLFVQGSVDVFGNAEALAKLVHGLRPTPAVHVLPAADHFFAGRLDGVYELLAAWTASEPWETPRLDLA